MVCLIQVSFLRNTIVVPYFLLCFSNTYSAWCHNTTEFQVTRLKVKVIMIHKSAIISSTIAMNVFNVKAS